MTVTGTPGLRERKRIATRVAIQRAVLQLAVERGLDNVTVEEVSRRADISPRTFFNYFVSKEAAIAGDGPTLMGEEALERFVSDTSGTSILRAVGAMLSEAAETATDDREMLLMRRSLHKEYPHLFALRMAGMKQFEDELTSVVARRLVRDDPSLEADPDELQSRARLITLVAFGVLRHAWTCWADTDSRDTLAARIKQSFEKVDAILVSEATR